MTENIDMPPTDLEPLLHGMLKAASGMKVDITGATELLRDLGMWGDDAGAFFVSYFDIFSVNHKGFVFTDFFPREGDHFWIGIKAFFQHRNIVAYYKPVAVDDLLRAAYRKSWDL